MRLSKRMARCRCRCPRCRRGGDWTLPTTRGDCEDYQLLKRHRLMQSGWPSGALLMTVVRDEKNEGHAVLTARTTQGDFILDNKIDIVRLWNQTPYHYVMRQSYMDPKVWVSLDPSDASTPAAIAGVQSTEPATIFEGIESPP